MPSITPIVRLMTIAFVCAGITACGTQTPDNLQPEGEAYIRAHIAELSPEPPVLGGQFYVTAITWLDSDTALVEYEDGHIALMGETDVSKNGDTVTASRLRLQEEEEEEEAPPIASSSSTAGRPLAKEGAFCGGIAAFQCEPGLTCLHDGTYPDAGGTCVRE